MRSGTLVCSGRAKKIYEKKKFPYREILRSHIVKILRLREKFSTMKIPFMRTPSLLPAASSSYYITRNHTRLFGTYEWIPENGETGRRSVRELLKKCWMEEQGNMNVRNKIHPRRRVFNKYEWNSNKKNASPFFLLSPSREEEYKKFWIMMVRAT